ncbi:MAG: molybdenum cofactor biosynthesis protein MoaE [Rhodobacteraceae bacterium]|nr:molybdenum cofactor biosynthesis protein MoaE [Paracoccaceae bacterium]
MQVRVQAAPFDFGAEAGAFAQGHTTAGAIVTFCGVVRDDGPAGLERMEIEHYPGMTERALEQIATQAMDRFALDDCLILHRHGPMRPGETIMMVATAARHRAAAFAAAEFLMDYLKSRAPFWKKEIARDGASWVAAKDQDEAALARWTGED